MKTHHRHAIKLSCSMIALYAVSTSVLIFLNHQVGPWIADLAWPVYWIIWLFAYWPIALAAFACDAILRPPRRRALALHVCYIALTLIVMQCSLQQNTSWPLVILKITGLTFAFTCITVLPRKRDESSK